MDTYRTLIDVEALAARLAASAPTVVLDCRFDLADPSAGEAAYEAKHLPGARYVHLDRDLSGLKTGRNGRHPLPERVALAAWAGRMGIAPGVQVVAYDDQGGPYAARCWWLLRWLGHEAVAVLDGGFSAWRAAGQAFEDDEPAPLTGTSPYPAAAKPAMPTVDADALQSALGRVRLVDARNGARFRGETEPLDPVAGHIPGATLRFFQDNLVPGGRFKPAEQLRAEFDAWATPTDRVVHQCGSGVTACHNLLAMTHAGLEGSALYPGSWSEWCADPARPVATG
ncbi:sulfurtransferase [Rubrivivax albus]|uniref:Sulfurtransferase n=1 Tax=Rubrivivax albus TaxID=2499835 RepID=A0A3S3SCX7_9BURK|nr:sulfurtransferase [Rubrivivax albus]RVT52085.1 sulfurtransferase [Rubrivivax albus]